MAVKVNSVEYGADMKVVQTFSGTLQPEQVIRVWGDCGLLCRYYVDGVANGDTVIWAIQHTDLSGNFGCGTQFEQHSDYQLSVCGVYWLGYGNGIVSGPLTEEGIEQQVTIAEFQALVDGCLSTAVPQLIMRGELKVRYTDEGPVVELAVGVDDVLSVFDPQGRAILRRAWNGTPFRIPDLAPGVFTVEVTRVDHRWVHKVLIR